MMKRIILIVLAVFLTASTANAQVDIFYSTSNSDSNAGSDLELSLGDSGSMYVWVTNNDGAVIDGMGVDFLSSDASVLEATGFSVDNSGGFWTNDSGGSNLVLGDLVTNQVSIALPGLSGTGQPNDGTAYLYGQIDFDTTALGTTDLSIAENSFLISVSGNSPQSVNFGNGSVTVVNAIPEPSSVLVLAGLLGGVLLRRRR